MLYCEVVTGKQYETRDRMPDLTAPPTGYNSVKAVGTTPVTPSQFKVKLTDKRPRTCTRQSMDSYPNPRFLDSVFHI